MDYPEIFKYLRAQKNISQTELASKLAISQKQVSDIERGVAALRPTSAEKVNAGLRRLGVPDSDIPPVHHRRKNHVGNTYNAWKLVYDAMDDCGESVSTNIGDGRGGADFWEALRNQKIHYQDVATLREVFDHLNVDECQFFAYCTVFPLTVLDSDNGSEVLTIKLYHELLELTACGGKYVAHGSPPTANNIAATADASTSYLQGRIEELQTRVGEYVAREQQLLKIIGLGRERESSV
jgi:transcriptional regulator with XRE-family HTH domain